MKKNSRLMKVVLIFVLFFAQVSTLVFAQEDVTPPNIISVLADKTSLKVEDTVTFDVEVEDDFSGPNTLYIQWNLENDNTKTISKQYDSMRDEGSYKFVIPANTPAGKWKAEYVSIADNNNNYNYYYRDDSSAESILSKFDFTVEDTNQDIEAPIVSNVKIITADITSPCDVIIQLDITDNKSGINVKYCGIGYSPVKNRTHVDIVNIEKIDNNTYQANFHVSSQYDKYVFEYVQVSDNAGNYKEYTYSDLGLTNELDIIPSNYKEDTTAPKLLSYEYSKAELVIPDYVTVTMDIEEYESGVEAFYGNAYFKSDDGKYNKELTILTATDENGLTIKNKGSVRLDFGDSETFTGKVYLYKVTLKDKAGNSKTYSVENGDFEKKEFNVKKIEKNYTLTTSNTKKGYIDQISKLPNGSTVLCNISRDNQIIEKELFEAIKGKDITITFMSIYSANGEIINSGSSVSTSDTNTGIQWIINGKDIINETKDINMIIKISEKVYSKYIVSGYEINEKLEQDFWKNLDITKMSEEETKSKEKELRQLQKKEIIRYLDKLKADGYTIPNTVYENAFAEIEYGSYCKDAIIYGNEYVTYISIEFAENGLLPCKTLIRLKPDYAMRTMVGAKNLIVYYADKGNFDLIQDNIDMDSEKYYNFTIAHNSEYCLTNKSIQKLAKTNTNMNNKAEGKNELDETPKTGSINNLGIVSIISVLSITGVILLKRNY